MMTEQLCEYGCGKKATYRFKNGKWCCEKILNRCPNRKKSYSKVMTVLSRNCIHEPAPLNESELNTYLCYYGCGNYAKFKYGNGHYCCSESTSACQALIKRRVKSNKGYRHSEETLKKMSQSQKGKPAWNKGKTGIFSEEALKKISEASKKRVPWNKGKKGCYTLSKETRKKISDTLKYKNLKNKGNKDD
jgi:hypothetical protein